MRKLLIQKVSLIVADVMALVLSLVIVNVLLNLIRPGIDHISFATLGVAKLSGFLLIILFWYQEQYVKRRPIWEEVKIIVYTVCVFAFFHAGISYLMSHHIIKLLTLLFWLVLLIILPSLRYIGKKILDKFGLWRRGVYILGTKENAIAAYNLLSTDKILGYNFLGFIHLIGTHNPSLLSVDDKLDGYLKVGNTSIAIIDLNKLLNDEKQERDIEIVFALNSNELPYYAKIINILQSKYDFVSIIPDISGIPLYGVELNHFFGSDQLFLRLQNNLSRRFNRVIKRIVDLILASIGIIILTPLFIVIALFIKIFTRGNVFFEHKRIGLDGKSFYCIKFQTMYPNSQDILRDLLAHDANAKHEWEQNFKLKNDPRITPIGKFLRRTSLDELPQLLNVIKGDMSLVGPRPIVEAELKRYKADEYYYKLVRPGITGLWQISGRNDVDYTTRVHLDVNYIKNWSLWYDFVILLKTILVVFSRGGAY